MAGLGSGPGQIGGPTGVAVDNKGHVYVSDGGNNRIQKFTDTGVFVTKWGSEGSGHGQFDFPSNVAVWSPPGAENLTRIFVTDFHNNRVQIFRSWGSWALSWGTGGSGPGQFNLPSGIDVQPPPPGETIGDLRVYVADAYNHRIQELGYRGDFYSTWGSFGSGQYLFKYPGDVAEYTAVGGAQKVYVADTRNNRVHVYTKQ